MATFTSKEPDFGFEFNKIFPKRTHSCGSYMRECQLMFQKNFAIPVPKPCLGHIIAMALWSFRNCGKTILEIEAGTNRLLKELKSPLATRAQIEETLIADKRFFRPDGADFWFLIIIPEQDETRKKQKRKDLNCQVCLNPAIDRPYVVCKACESHVHLSCEPLPDAFFFVFSVIPYWCPSCRSPSTNIFLGNPIVLLSETSALNSPEPDINNYPVKLEQ